MDDRQKDALFILEEARVLSEVRRRRCHRILVQAPEGLRDQALRLAGLIEKELRVKAYVSANPCFGACNLALAERAALGADLVVHIGHSRLPGIGDEGILYVEAKSPASTVPVLERILPLLKDHRRIGLITTVQHVDRLEEAMDFLESKGKGAFVGEPRGRLVHPGQVLGCDYSALESIEDRVDAFLYIGGGTFHPLGAALRTHKPVFAADPFTLEVRCMDSYKRQLLRRRYAQIAMARKARSFGVLIGLEPGQINLELAEELVRRLEAKGFKVFRMSVNILFPNALEDFRGIEAFVNTACPRIAFESPEAFGRPILTPEETLILLGEKAWDEYAKEAHEEEKP